MWAQVTLCVKLCPIIPPVPHVAKATLQRTQLHVLSSSTNRFRKSADFFLHYTTLGKLFLQTLKIIFIYLRNCALEVNADTSTLYLVHILCPCLFKSVLFWFGFLETVFPTPTVHCSFWQM